MLVWPRLFRVLPEALLKDLAAIQQDLDLRLNVSLSAFIVVIVGVMALPFASSSTPTLFFTIVGVGLVVAFASYRAAVSTTIAYGELIRSAFDLYRKDLLKQLELEVPRHDTQERELWKALQDAWYYGSRLPRPS